MRQVRSHAALRGFAALLVVAYHLQFGASYYLPIETGTALFRRSYLLVDLFFVLSGFIISYVNRADRDTPIGRGEVTDFYRARIARLYPLHLFCLALLVCVTLLNTGVAIVRHHPPDDAWTAASLMKLAAQILLLNAWWGEGWNIPSWSISAELVAYALFPLAVAAHLRRPGLTRLALLLGALAFYAAILASTRSLDIVVGLAPLRCLSGFALGMLVYFHRNRIARCPLALLSAIQIVAVGCIILLLARTAPDPLIMLPFVALVAACWTDIGIVPRLIGHGSWLWLGEISYSIYLTHVPVIHLTAIFWNPVAARLPLDPASLRVAWIALIFTLVIAVSRLTFVHVERPARQWLARRWLGHRLPPIAQSPPAP